MHVGHVNEAFLIAKSQSPHNNPEGLKQIPNNQKDNLRKVMIL